MVERLKDNIQLPASIVDEAYRYMPMPNVVRADYRNGEFEKYYAVYIRAKKPKS